MFLLISFSQSDGLACAVGHVKVIFEQGMIVAKHGESCLSLSEKHSVVLKEKERPCKPTPVFILAPFVRFSLVLVILTKIALGFSHIFPFE